MATISPNQSQIQIALRSFLLGILPAGTEVIQGQGNRVPEPKGADFVVMTPIRRERLATNVDSYLDCEFTGSIAGSMLTVTEVVYGEVEVGATIYGASVAANTLVTAEGTGTGGIGTYVVSPAPQAVSAATMFAGAATFLQRTKVTMQLDVHGPSSSDNAQAITTMLRDAYAVDAFAAAGYPSVTPLHADEARQVPFINAEQQYEYRWSIDAQIQADQVVSGFGQQFFDAADITLVSADAPT
jgi:hypothetical protein